MLEFEPDLPIPLYHNHYTNIIFFLYYFIPALVFGEETQEYAPQ